ncbi:MAG: 3D domain-containing protein [Clostridiaceae bacterium]|nr:3D domain-containing protein [Clostridiaceae bacterium]
MIKQFLSDIKDKSSSGSKKQFIIGFVVILAVIIILAVVGMRKTIVIDINGTEESFVTYKGTVKDVLEERGITLSSKDKVEPSLSSNVDKGDVIKVKSAVPVKVVCNGVEVNIETAENNIQDMLEVEESTLNEAGISFNKDIDEVSPSLDSNIQQDLQVQIVKVETKMDTVNEEIDYDTVVQKDDTLDSGTRKVKSEGVKGQKETVYQVVYKDGQEVSREVRSMKTVVEPESKIVLEGTKTVYVSRDGVASGKKKLTCTATAYSGGKATATGRTPQRVVGGISTIAVDPSVIPLGSKVYIDGYGYAIAADTGSAIKGNKIDLYFNNKNEPHLWGVRTVEVTIVAYPGEW